MKSIMVLLLISLLSAFFICCTLINTTDAGLNENCAAFKRGVDVNDDPTINVNGENATPIIGVLSQELSNLGRSKYPDRKILSYIGGSYVKFVEGAGGRVLPIWIGKERDYYEDILSKINGVLLPGGVSKLINSQGYSGAGRHIYEIAIEMNKQGNYMPIWGACLGLQFMVYLTANDTGVRSNCSSHNQALNLEFKEGFRKSRMFTNASDEVINILEKFPVTANSHHYCITEENFAKYNISELWNVISLNHDWNGEEFISTIEHKIYPFYGIQFHPEKNLYEFIANNNITHISKAIIASQFFAQFFVNEARKNYNRFSNKTEEMYSLIYNYNPEYTSVLRSVFMQQYLFEQQEYLFGRSGALEIRIGLPSMMVLLGAILLSAL